LPENSFLIVERSVADPARRRNAERPQHRPSLTGRCGTPLLFQSSPPWMGPMTVNLLRPPTFALVASLALLSVGVITGGLLTVFQDSIYAAARREIIKRPEVHRFAGTEIIDQARITEVADQSNTAL